MVSSSALILKTLIVLAAKTAILLTRQGSYVGFGPLSMDFECAIGGGRYVEGQRHAYCLPTREGDEAGETVCKTCYEALKPFAGELYDHLINDLTLTNTRLNEDRCQQCPREGRRVVHTSWHCNRPRCGRYGVSLSLGGENG
jgi:hypothetical protein